jgi:hypothetical protein
MWALEEKVSSLSLSKMLAFFCFLFSLAEWFLLQKEVEVKVRLQFLRQREEAKTSL